MPVYIDLNEDELKVSTNLGDIRSEPLQEIISHRSGFITRWALMFFISLLLLLFVTSWFIRYPDKIQVSAKLASINPPKAIISLTNGKLIKLNITENQKVNKYQILGYIESTASHDEVLKLSSNIDEIRMLIDEKKEEVLPVYFHNSFTNLGELQPYYQTFYQSFIVFKDYLSNGYYQRKKIMLAKDMENLLRLHSNLILQKNLSEEDLMLAKKTFAVNQSFSDDKIISDLEYRNEASKLINKKMSIPQINASIINNEGQQNEKKKEIADLEKTINQQKSIFLQAFNTFKSHLDDWKRKYLLISPTSGTIVFASIIQENQQLEINQIVSYVNPENTQYYAQVIIPQYNFGKVSIGQEVLLKFPSYPYHEFGLVKGNIEFISRISSDSGYFAKVRLTNGLTTNYNNQIQFREGLIAQGEIITRDMRLLERLYLNIIKEIKR